MRNVLRNNQRTHDRGRLEDLLLRSSSLPGFIALYFRFLMGSGEGESVPSRVRDTSEDGSEEYSESEV